MEPAPTPAHKGRKQMEQTMKIAVLSVVDAAGATVSTVGAFSSLNAAYAAGLGAMNAFRSPAPEGWEPPAADADADADAAPAAPAAPEPTAIDLDREIDPLAAVAPAAPKASKAPTTDAPEYGPLAALYYRGRPIDPLTFKGAWRGSSVVGRMTLTLPAVEHKLVVNVLPLQSGKD